MGDEASGLVRAGELLGEGVITADLDGLTALVAGRGLEVSAAVR